MFDKSGSYKRQFGKEGSNPGELIDPSYIHVDDEIIFVSEFRNRRVSVFNTRGEYISSVGKGEGLECPRGVAMGKDGFLYICDHDSRNIQIF